MRKLVEHFAYIFFNDTFLNKQQLSFCHGWSEDAKNPFLMIFNRTDLKISLYHTIWFVLRVEFDGDIHFA